MAELDHLVHSAQGRALLRGSLGAAVLHALEGSYDVAPSSPVAPLARSAPALTTSRRPAGVHTPVRTRRIVAPSLAVWPRGVAPGARLAVAVQHARFAPGERIAILLDGRTLASVTVSARGVAPSIGLNAPASARAGSHRLTVSGLRGSRRVTGLLRVYGLSVARGRVVTGGPLPLRGAGFAPGQVVRFTLRQGAGRSIPLGFGGTDAAGALVPIRLDVPFAAASGRAALVASDGAGERIDVPLIIAARRAPIAARTAFIPVTRLYIAPARLQTTRVTLRARAGATIARRPAMRTTAPRPVLGTRMSSRATPRRAARRGGPGATDGGHALSHAALALGARHIGRLVALTTRYSAGARARVEAVIHPIRAGPAPRVSRAYMAVGPRPPAAVAAAVHADDGCYHQSEAGFTFDSVYCPISNTSVVTDVVVTPPSLLGVQTPITLPSVTIGGDGKPALPLRLPDLNITESGFSVSAVTNTLTASGLTIGAIGLALPATLGGLNLSATNVAIGTDGSISGTVSLAPSTLAVSYAGFSVTLTGVSLTQQGVGVAQVAVAIPSDILPTDIPNVPTSLTVNNVRIGFDGTLSAGPVTTGGASSAGAASAASAVSAAGARPALATSLPLPPFTGVYGGFDVSLKGVSIGLGGLTVGDAELGLPSSLLPSGASPITVTGALTITRGSGAPTSIDGVLGVGPVSLALGGYTVATDGVTLSRAGLAISNARLVLPASLFPAGSAPPMLTGNLNITPAFSVTGSLATGAFSIPVDGFTVSADGITLSNAGLVVNNARLAFPASLFPAGSAPPVLTGNLTIDSSFKVTASLATGPFSIPLYGFTIAADGITLSNSGLVVSNARLTLPASLLPAGSSPITLVGNLAVDASFKVTASLAVSNVTIAYNGYAFHVDSIVLSNNGLVVSNATLALPADLGGGTVVGNLTVTPAFAVNGTLVLAHPNFAFHGTTVSADSIGLALTSSQAAGVTVAFGIVNARVRLPEDAGGLTLVGNLTASFGSGGTQVVGQLSTTNAHFTYRGFVVDSGVVTLDNNGIRASGVSLTLPARFNVNGQPVVLSGALGLEIAGGKTTFTGSLGIQNVSLSVYGFTATVGSVTVGTDGFVLLNASLSLPQAVSTLFKVNTLSLASLTITRDYQVTATANSLSFSLAGASISTGPLSVGTGGIAASNASVTLPSQLGGSTFTMPNLAVAPSGDTSGAVSGKTIGFNLGGLAISASGFGFQSGAIVIAQLSASLPVFQEGLTLQGLSFDGHHVSLTGGTAMLTLPPINAGGFTISAQALLSFSEVGGALTFDIAGSGTINIPSLGQFHCALEVGSVDANHPSHLYSAELDVQLHAGVPIGVGPFQSGLELNGINGGIRIGRNQFTGAALVTLHLGLDVGTDDGGYLFEGNMTGAVATDGNFGVGGGGAFLSGLIQMSGGFCLRFSAQNDGVCSVTLHNNGPRIDASGSIGFYAEVTFGKTVHVRKDITVQASAYAHIWRDSDGPEASADIAATVDVPSSSLLPAIPPKSFNLSAGGQFGKFRKGGQIYRGMKLSLTYHLLGKDHTYSLFVDSNGNAHVGASDYTIIDAGNNIGYLLASLPNGVTMASRLANRVLAAPLHRGEMQARLRILPGQSDGLFTLYWRRGAPVLTLVAPDGARYSQSTGGVAMVSTSRSALPAGYSGGATIVPPVLEPGVWTVRIGNLRGDEGYKLTVDAANPRPRLRVTAPAGGRTAVASPSTLIRGTLDGPTTANTVSLYYTTSRTSIVKGSDGRLSTVPNLSGAALAEGVAVRNGAFSYRWDTRALPRGVYYVYAVLDNGFDAEVAAYAHGRILVRQPARPGAPRSVVAARHGRQLHIVWSPPSRTDVLAGYKLYWRTSDMAAGAYHTLDLGDTQSFDLGETRPGVSYEAAVAAYDLSGAQSGKTTATVVSENRGGATFRVAAPADSVRAGGTVALPLALAPRGAATRRTADYVDVSVGALPSGVTVVPTLRTANLFARFERGDPSAPALTVQTSAFASPTAPGHPDQIPVTVRQEGTGRAVTIVVPLTIRTGAPGQLNMWYGTPTRRPDGLMSVPVVAKVVDRSGGGAIDGTEVTFSATDGVVKKADVTTTATTPDCVTMPTALCGPAASIQGGFAATTVVYAPGTHPYVTGDTGTAVGALYIGASPAGASRSRYFAITESAAARQRRAQDGLRLTNKLDAAAHVRVDYWTLRPGDFPRERIAILLVSPHSSVALPLDPASTTALNLPRVEAPRGLTLGVHVISDLPVLSEQVVRRDVSRGAGPLQGFSRGVDEGRVAARWTFRLPAGRAVVDLYTGRTRAVSATVTGRARDGRTVSARVNLAPHGSAGVDVDALFAARHIHPRGAIVVTVMADKALAAEPQL